MFKRLIATIALAAALAGPASAQFPDKPIRLLLHVTPGGATDIMGRRIAAELEKELGVPIVVENLAGGRGAAQLAALSQAAPDGYTLGTVTPTHIGNFHQTLRQYSVDSFDWIARLVTEPYLVAVRADSPIRSMNDLVSAAKDRPGEVVMAGFVRGSGSHLAWEMIADKAGIPGNAVRWVPYDSAGDAVTAVLGGHGEVVIHHVVSVREHVNAGNLRVIGVMSKDRLAQLPDVATFAEQRLPVDTSWQQFRGLIGPAGIPAERKARLDAAIEKVMQTPDIQRYLTESALVGAYLPADEFTTYAKTQDAATQESMRTLGLVQ